MEMYHWLYFLHDINSDRQTRVLNVLGQIAMIVGDKKKKLCREFSFWMRPSWLNIRVWKLQTHICWLSPFQKCIIVYKLISTIHHLPHLRCIYYTMIKQLSSLIMRNFGVPKSFTSYFHGRFFPDNRGMFNSKPLIIISNLSNDRSKASSKTIPPHSAI